MVPSINKILEKILFKFINLAIFVVQNHIHTLVSHHDVHAGLDCEKAACYGLSSFSVNNRIVCSTMDISQENYMMMFSGIALKID